MVLNKVKKEVVIIQYCSRDEQAERGVAIVVHKSIVRSVVKKIVYNDRIIAIKLQADPISILLMQVYMLTSEHIMKLCEVLMEVNHIGILSDRMA